MTKRIIGLILAIAAIAVIVIAAIRFPAVFRPESYFLNLPRRRNTVPERLPLFECRKIP